ARGRIEQRADDADRRRLSRAVGADEAEDVAFGDGEADAPHRPVAFVVLGQVFDFDHGASATWRRVSPRLRSEIRASTCRGPRSSFRTQTRNRRRSETSFWPIGRTNPESQVRRIRSPSESGPNPSASTGSLWPGAIAASDRPPAATSPNGTTIGNA